MNCPTRSSRRAPRSTSTRRRRSASWRTRSQSFSGRKLGVLVSHGADAKTLRMLRKAADAEGMMFAVVAPTVEGIPTARATSSRSPRRSMAVHRCCSTPSPSCSSNNRADEIGAHPGAKDFVSDAHAHKKFVAYNDAAGTLFASRRRHNRRSTWLSPPRRLTQDRRRVHRHVPQRFAPGTARSDTPTLCLAGHWILTFDRHRSATSLRASSIVSQLDLNSSACTSESIGILSVRSVESPLSTRLHSTW